jgi:hypothetical protein
VIDLVPNGLALEAVEVWFQDEARVGQRGTVTRLWAPKGSRPRVIRQQQFEAAYVFGAVCPAEGKAVALVMPKANSESMQHHLEQIWQQLQQSDRANRCFKNYDDIVDVCCQAWNTFANQPDTIRNLCTRKWALIA